MAAQEIDALQRRYPAASRCGPTTKISTSDGIDCPLCCKDLAKGVMLLDPVYMGKNMKGDLYCRHIYTTEICAFFYWNADGSTYLATPNGSGYYAPRGGHVYTYGPRGDIPRQPRLPWWVITMDKDTKARFERRLRRIYRIYHPRSRMV